MAAQSSLPVEGVSRFRYRVSVQSADGFYKTSRLADNPVAAALSVLKDLGFGESDPYHPPLAVFVVPLHGGSA